MLLPGPESTAELVRLRFPGYILTAQGEWGELWTAPRDN